MPDYDLGRAHGEIILNADTSGADEAAVSMVALSAEAKALDEEMQRGGKSTEDLRLKHQAFANQVKQSAESSRALTLAEREHAQALVEGNKTATERNKLEQEAGAARRAAARDIKDLGAAQRLLTDEVNRLSQSYGSASKAAKTLDDALSGVSSASKDAADSLNVTSAASATLADKQNGLRQRLQESHEAAAELKKTHKDLNNELLNVALTTESLKEKQNAYTNAKRADADASHNVKEAYRAMREELQGANRAHVDYNKELQFTTRSHRDLQRALKDSSKGGFDEFGNTLKKTQQDLKGTSRDAKTLQDIFKDFVKIESTQSLLQSLAGSITAVRNASLAALGIGSAAGGLGLLGGGGAEGLVGIIGSVSELSGAIALLPGLLAGAGAAAGVLFVGLHNVSDVIQNMGDPAKFIQSLREVSPIARLALEDIQSYYSSFKGAFFEVQNSLFAPILADITPLVQTYLPLLMHAGQEIANVFGQAGHLFATWLETPAVVQTISDFLHNVAAGMQAALPAVQAFANAFLTITAVGGGFFVQLGDAISKIAVEFNNFISKAAQTGQLQAFIQNGIDAFGVLFHNIAAVTEGLGNIFIIGNQYGGGFLELFRNIGDEFLKWTQSAGGKSSIASFFETIHEAGQALAPILPVIGSALATIISTVVKLGVGISPALLTFFQVLNTALKALAPALIASAPAFTTFLNALGQLITKIAAAAGDNLAKFLTNFANAATDLVGPLGSLAGSLADFLGSLTPTEIQAILGLVAIFNILGTVIGAIAPIVAGIGIIFGGVTLAGSGVAIAIAAVVGGLIYAYSHWQTFHDIVQKVWDALKNFASDIPKHLSDAWKAVEDFFGKGWDIVKGWGHSIASNFADGIREGIGLIKDAAHEAAKAVGINWKPGSPTEAGPLSLGGGTGQWGSNLASNFATGISSGAGSVGNAASSVAGSASQGFTSKGDSGGQGAYGTPDTQDTFLKYIKNITDDLSAWSKIFHDGANLFNNVVNIGLKSIDTFARLYQGGINSLTAPGGIDQGAKPFIPQATLPGQQQVGDVPQVGPKGNITSGPGSPGYYGAAPTPASGPSIAANGPIVADSGNLPAEQLDQPLSPARRKELGIPDNLPPIYPSRPAGLNPDSTQILPPPPPTAGGPTATPSGQPKKWSQQDIANYIISSAKNAGATNEQANAFVAQAYGESSLGANTDGKDTGDSSGGAQGVFQFTPGTWNSFGNGTDVNNPKDNIDAYLRLFAARAGKPGDDIRAQLAKTSGGGPAYPNNIGLTWDQANAGAAPFITGSNAPGPPPPPPAGAPGAPGAPGTTVKAFSSLGPQQQSNIRIFEQYGVDPGKYGLPHSPEFKAPGGGTQSPPQPPNGGAGQGGSQPAGSGGAPNGVVTGLGVAAGTVGAGIVGYGAVTAADVAAAAAANAARSAVSSVVAPIVGAGETGGAAGAAGAFAPLTLGLAAAGLILGPDRLNKAIGSPAIPQRDLDADQFGGVKLTDDSQPLIPGGTGKGGQAERRDLPQPLTGPYANVLADQTKTSTPGSIANTSDPKHGGIPGAPSGAGTPVIAFVQQRVDAFNKANGTNLKITADFPGGPTGHADDGADHSVGRAVDISGSPRDMDAFASYWANDPALRGATRQLIHNPSADPGGPFSVDQNIIGGHLTPGWQTYGNGPEGEPGHIDHDHIALQYIPTGFGVPTSQTNSPATVNNQRPAQPTVPGSQTVASGVQLAAQQPNTIAGPGNVQPPQAVDGVPQAPIIQPQPFGAANTVATGTQLSSAAGGVVGSVFASVDSVIQSISAAADLADKVARIPKDTETVIKMIQDVQQFIKTGAQIAQTVSQVAGAVGQLAGGSSNPASAAMAGPASAVSAIAGLVGDALSAVDQGISLGIEVYHQIGKYAADIAGFTLGGANTGYLSGNVQALLNTNTGELYTYSADNPLNKNTLTPGFRNAYKNTDAPQNVQTTQLNIYAGPGQTTQQMMSDSMFLISTGGPAISSVSGRT